jgi:hypothetical protein
MRTLQASIVAAWLAVPAALQAQSLPQDTLDVLLESHRVLQRFGRDRGPDVWPGYRPDTIPFLYVIPGRGTLLLNWPDTLPSGFAPVPDVPRAGWRAVSDRSAASTGVRLSGRATAQVVVQSLAPEDVVGVSAHEAFHVFERASVREGRKFGRGENAFYVSQYPAFDTANEADFALEGRILKAAVETRSAPQARRLAQQFLAVRGARQRRLGAQLAEFESMAELNEGLAQYVQTRASAPALVSELALLDHITDNGNLSLRRRFYATGTALARLLDRLVGPAWKTGLVNDDLTLQDALARAAGGAGDEVVARREAERRFDRARLLALADSAVGALRARRQRQTDSLMARPGLKVEIVGRVGSCGFDPQNMLQAGGGVVLHTRWLHICDGARLDGEFNTPVVESGDTLTAVIGAATEVRVSVRGAPLALGDGGRVAGAEEVRIESPGLTLRVARADLERAGSVLRLRIAGAP